MIERAILQSVHPQWWDKMKSGEKTLEVRRTRPVNVVLPVRVIVYATAPVCAIVGEYLCPHFIKTNRVAGLQRASRVPLEQLERYANGRSLCGWRVRDLAVYPKPLPLSSLGLEHPPQSWCYVDVEDVWP